MGPHKSPQFLPRPKPRGPSPAVRNFRSKPGLGPYGHGRKEERYARAPVLKQYNPPPSPLPSTTTTTTQSPSTIKTLYSSPQTLSLGFAAASHVDLQSEVVDGSQKSNFGSIPETQWVPQDIHQTSQSFNKHKDFHSSHSLQNNILSSPHQTNKDQSQNFKAENSNQVFSVDNNQNKEFPIVIIDEKTLFEEVTPSKISNNLMQLTTVRAEDGKIDLFN